MNNNTDFIFHLSSDAIFDAALVFTISFIGIFCNLVSAIVLCRNRVFRNSFGQLTTLHAVANVGVLLLFAAWAVPLMIIEFPERLFWINRKLGQLSLFFTEVAFHACLFISFNRLSAIATPAFYRRYFNGKLTASIVLLDCVLSGIYWSFYFIDGCDFYFDSSFREWAFSDTPCGVALAYYVDFVYNVSLFCLVGILDMVTLFILRNANKRLAQSTTESSKRTKREIRFFIQALTNTLVYAFMLVCFHIIINFMTSDFTIFLATTVVWGFSHACGGVIMVLFNREIWRLFKSPRSFFKLMLDTRSMSMTTRKEGKSTFTVQVQSTTPINPRTSATPIQT